MNTLDRATLTASWHRWWSYDAPKAGPAWLQAVWTLLFSLVLAAGFTLLWFVSSADGAEDWLDPRRWALGYGRNLVVTLVISFLIQGLFLLAEFGLGVARIRALQGWRRTLFFAGIPLLGLGLGWPLGYRILMGRWPALSEASTNAIVGALMLALLLSLVFQIIWIARNREVAARMQATEAQLKLLQAQIEPHFLFNTLANVLSLIDADAPRAKAMLEAFIDYLRSSLQQQRRAEATLGEELALAEAYLLLMGARMGERLRFQISATPEARAFKLPPLLLQPLVENAIRHGLEPKIDGGTVHIDATLHGGRLRLCVRDDGLGLDAPKRPGPRGAGMALANIRERLAARHGSEASLRLDRRADGVSGTCAILELPA